VAPMKKPFLTLGHWCLDREDRGDI